MKRYLTYILLGLACSLQFLGTNRAHGQGIIIPWGGPVNAGMGGAGTAAPTDAIGAIYWNPATTSGLDNELSVGLGFLVPVLETSSSLTGVAAGTSSSEAGASALPSFGLVHHVEDTPVTFSLGVSPVAGFGTNYSSSQTNPFFIPQSNTPGTPGGFGAVFSRATFLQIAPSLSYAVSDKLSIAFGPTITTGEIVVDPLILGPLNDADGSMQPRYGPGRGTRYAWGGGAQVGVYYEADNCWSYGASLKSPQWMEEFRVRSSDELQRPTVVRYKVDLPMILSLGTAYRGIQDTVVAMDVRYFDYRNTDGLGDKGFNPDGSVRGLNMSSIFSVALGARRKISDDLFLQAGYSFNQSPFQDHEATFAVAAPIYYQHVINTGASVLLADNLWLNLSYSYSPSASLTGPIQSPTGPVPNTSVTTREQIHAAQLGITMKR